MFENLIGKICSLTFNVNGYPKSTIAKLLSIHENGETILEFESPSKHEVFYVSIKALATLSELPANKIDWSKVK